MPVWPKSFYTFRASLLTARTASRLRGRGKTEATQRRTCEGLLRQLATTSFWREAGIEAGISYDQFRTRVAPRQPEQLAPAIERMKCGEADVLWPGRCTFFAASAGTTTGQPRHVPVTTEMFDHFRAAAENSLMYYTARAGHAGVFRGRHLFAGSSNALKALREAKPDQAYLGDLCGIGALGLPHWAEKHFCEPGTAIARMPDWDAKLAAIAARTRTQDISLLAGMPSWLLVLAQALLANATPGQAQVPNLQSLWPNLECVVHGGAPVAPFLEELRQACGPGVAFHEIYPSVEGFIAAQDAAPDEGLRVLVESGLFFEFLPLADFATARIEHLAAKAIPLAEVKTGQDYVLLLTTPAGLARYVTEDIVRFVSTEPPRLIHVGRTALRLDAFGENVSEKETTEALLATCQRHRWSIVNFHVAPLTSNNLTGQNRGRHEWWIELRPGTVETPIGPLMAAEIDAEMQRLSSGYRAKRKAGALDSPTVRLVMPGVFEHWLRFHGKWGGQHRMPRCRGDRLVADELAQVTNFARD